MVEDDGVGADCAGPILQILLARPGKNSRHDLSGTPVDVGPVGAVP